MNESVSSMPAAILSEETVRNLAILLNAFAVLVVVLRRRSGASPGEKALGWLRLKRFGAFGSFAFLSTFMIVVAILRWDVSSDSGLTLALIASSVPGIVVGMIMSVIPDIRRACAELAGITRSTHRQGDMK